MLYKSSLIHRCPTCRNVSTITRKQGLAPAIMMDVILGLTALTLFLILEIVHLKHW